MSVPGRTADWTQTDRQTDRRTQVLLAHERAVSHCWEQVVGQWDPHALTELPLVINLRAAQRQALFAAPAPPVIHLSDPWI